MRRLILFASIALTASVVTAPSEVHAHGIWAHSHVTGWAIESLPTGELRSFFSHPEVANAAIYGATFTDSGYWPQTEPLKSRAHAFGEYNHWEPFVQGYIAWIVANDPPPWTTLESKKRAAFIMGCASHGLQDELFDSHFLYQAEIHDKGNQDGVDPGTDGFLALDEHLRFYPQRYLPMDLLLELYSELDEEISEDDILKSVGAMEVYIGVEIGLQITKINGETWAPDLPWTVAHYMDPAIPGSIRAEILPTARYIEAIWKRLHGTLGPADTVVAQYPDAPRRLRSVEAGTPDSWVTFIFGIGVSNKGITSTWVEGDAKTAIDHRLKVGRWGGPWSRIQRLQPKTDLTPGAWSTVEIPAGLTRIDGVKTEAPFAITVQAPCSEGDSAACPDLGPLPGPGIDGPSPWLEAPDAGAEDTGESDADKSDAGAGSPDSDAGTEPESPVSPKNDGGCSGGNSGPLWTLWLGLLAVGMRRRTLGHH